MHWPHPEGSRGEGERDALIHTIGNLTLLTSRLNSKVSNGPWLGDTGKKHGLEAHDVLLLNRELLKSAGENWTDAAILARSEELSTLNRKRLFKADFFAESRSKMAQAFCQRDCRFP